MRLSVLDSVSFEPRALEKRLWVVVENQDVQAENPCGNSFSLPYPITAQIIWSEIPLT